MFWFFVLFSLEIEKPHKIKDMVLYPFKLVFFIPFDHCMTTLTNYLHKETEK